MTTRNPRIRDWYFWQTIGRNSSTHVWYIFRLLTTKKNDKVFAYEKYAILADHIELIFARNDFFIAMATYLQLTFTNSSLKEIEICSNLRIFELSGSISFWLPPKGIENSFGTGNVRVFGGRVSECRLDHFIFSLCSIGKTWRIQHNLRLFKKLCRYQLDRLPPPPPPPPG